MLYVLYGTNEKAAREKAAELVGHLRAKKPDAEYVRITEDEYSLRGVLEYASQQGLFERKGIILLDHILEDIEKSEELINQLPILSASPNVFIFLEGELDKKMSESLKKSAGKVQEFSLKPAPKKIKFNVFSISDAFGKRDLKLAWMLYIQAKQKEIAVEEIHGALMWQVKSMLLASEYTSATQAGLSPFVFTKSKQYSKKYNKKELADISRELIAIYHEGHRKGTMDTLLELQLLGH